MITRITILIAILMLAQSIQLTLQDGNHILFNSSLFRDTISVSLTSYGKRNSSFFIESQVLSPLVNRHKLIHGQKRIQFQPQLNQQAIAFNDLDGSEYWLTIKQKVKFSNSKDVQFVGLTIIDGNNQHNYLLPAFRMPFSFLPFGTFYRCDKILISFAIFDNGIDVAFFSRSDHVSQPTWVDEVGKWGWHWRKQLDNYHFGRYTSEDKQSARKITLTNGRYCEIIPKQLKKNNSDVLKKSRYVGFSQVLQSSIPLQIKKIQHEQL